VLSWLRHGAQPTVTVRTLLKRHGVWKEFETEKSAKVEKTAKPEKAEKAVTSVKSKK